MIFSAVRSIGAAVVALAVAIPSACTAHEDEKVVPVVRVKVAQVERGDIDHRISVVGAVSPEAEATVAPKIGGPIAAMRLLKGTHVRSGETLATIEAGDLKAALSQADGEVREAEAFLRQTRSGDVPEATAESAKAIADAEAHVRQAQALVDRRKALFAQGGISQRDLDDAEFDLQTARNELDLARKQMELRKTSFSPSTVALAASRLDQARARQAAARTQLSYATVQSPIDGVVIDQFHQKGDYVPAGEKLFVVADTRGLIVKAQVPSADALLIRGKATASVVPVDGPSDPIEGVVRVVTPSVDASTRASEVWIDVPPSQALRPGGVARVEIELERHSDSLLIPVEAVSFDDPGNPSEGSVMAVDADSVAHETKVTTGIRDGESIEILSGLAERDTVVVEGNYALPDGAKVDTTAEPDDGESDEP